MMAATEDVFRFTALRDPQRVVRPYLLLARTYDAVAPSRLHTAIVAAANASDRAERADEYSREPGAFAANPADRDGAPRFVSELSGAPDFIRTLDESLSFARDRLDGAEVMRIVLPRGAGQGDQRPARLRAFLNDRAVHGDWRNIADSMLALIFGTARSSAARGALARVLMLYELLDRLASGDRLNAVRVAELLAGGLLLTPIDHPAIPSEVEEDEPALEEEEPSILLRLQRLTAAEGALALAAGADGEAAAQRDSVSPAIQLVLEEEGLDLELSSAELRGELRERAHRIVEEALGGRWPGGGPVAIDTRITPVSSARLLSPPIIGDLKVVRQTLRGYRFGEIAHVENVLKGERKVRRHDVVDVREEETTETTGRDEERVFDTQTTERSDLARESQNTMASDERFNLGGTLEASYPPYVKLTATAGYAKATSRTESTTTSTRFAREVTERATTRIRTRTEEVRRRLTRTTINELNRHELNNTDGDGPVVGIYRWLNKEYCAQVFDYGRRVLLEIGVSDPSADYIYAVARTGKVDVGVEPPPPLVFPGTATPLLPTHIGVLYWESLAAHFRVPDFPPPPAMPLTTVTMAFASEAAPEPQGTASASSTSGGGSSSPPPPKPPAGMFEVNRELAIPNGYLPNSFTAVVLSAGGEVPEPEYLAGPALDERDSAFQGVRGLLDTHPWWAARILPLTLRWTRWLPSNEPTPTLTPEEFETAAVIRSALSANEAPMRFRRSLRSYLDAARGWPPRGGVDLAVGPSLVSVPFGARRVRGVFEHGQRLGAPAELTAAEPGDYTLPLAAATEAGAGFAITITVLCEASPELERRWQAEAYEAILAAHASWQRDYRTAAATAETRRGVTVEGRNPRENELIVRAELKRSSIAMLGGVTSAELQAVIPGDPLGVGTPPRLDLDAAARAGQVVRFYEQAFEWEHMAFMLYPYFWTGRDDWPEASLRADPDPQMTWFLRSGYARIVLPVRPGYEKVVESRLNLDLPEPFETTPAPTTTSDTSISIAEEIRAAQALAGGRPDGDPWPVTLPTTLVALDGTPLPWEKTPCDPKKEP